MHFWMCPSLFVCVYLCRMKKKRDKTAISFLYYMLNLLFLIPTSIALSYHWGKNNVSNFAYNCAITALGKSLLNELNTSKPGLLFSLIIGPTFSFYGITLGDCFLLFFKIELIVVTRNKYMQFHFYHSLLKWCL